MSEFFGIELIGLKEVERKLKKFVGEEKLEKLLDLMALEVEGEAKRRCPVRTGRLRNSITIAKQKLKRWVGTSVEYAPYVEYGTVKMEAQPYLHPAYEKVKRKFGFLLNKVWEGGE